MARARSIKPTFFTDVALLDLPMAARLLFAGLWCWADKNGRMVDHPRQIKQDILPADDVDCNELLNLIAAANLITRYSVDGKAFLEVRNFIKHQKPHPKEIAGVIPSPSAEPCNFTASREKEEPSREKDLASNAFPSYPSVPSFPSVPSLKPLCSNPSSKPAARGGKEVFRSELHLRSFEEFWKFYWRKTAKKDAQRAYVKNVTSTGAHAKVMAALSAQGGGMLAREPEKRPHAATWLNGQRWNDEPDPMQIRKTLADELSEAWSA